MNAGTAHKIVRRRADPRWARWNDELDVRYTLGVEVEVLAENRFLAARDGMNARMIERQRCVATEAGTLDDVVPALADQFLAPGMAGPTPRPIVRRWTP